MFLYKFIFLNTKLSKRAEFKRQETFIKKRLIGKYSQDTEGEGL